MTLINRERSGPTRAEIDAIVNPGAKFKKALQSFLHRPFREHVRNGIQALPAAALVAAMTPDSGYTQQVNDPDSGYRASYDEDGNPVVELPADPEVAGALIAGTAATAVLVEPAAAQETTQEAATVDLRAARMAEALTNTSGTPIEGGYFFKEDTGTFFKTTGFAVTGPMSEIFFAEGGDGVWGRPISREYTDELGRINQAFEKTIFQISPDGKGGYNIEYANIFDELGKLGKDGWLEERKQTPPSQDWSSDTGKSWTDVLKNHLGTVDSYPALREYITRDDNWLNKYGLPVSIKDYGPWVSVRTQRANVQLYKEKTAWANEGDILVANGGSVAKEIGPKEFGGIIPRRAMFRQLLAENTVTEPEYTKVPDQIGSLSNGDFVEIHNMGLEHAIDSVNFADLNRAAQVRNRKVIVEFYDHLSMTKYANITQAELRSHTLTSGSSVKPGQYVFSEKLPTGEAKVTIVLPDNFDRAFPTDEDKAGAARGITVTIALTIAYGSFWDAPSAKRPEDISFLYGGNNPTYKSNLSILS